MFRRSFGSVRAKATLGACVIAATAILGGSLGLLGLLSRSLTGNIDTVAQLRAEDLAGLILAGTIPDPVALPAERDSNRLAGVLGVPGGDSEDVVIQVVDGSRRVVASSGNLGDSGPIASFRPRAGKIVVRNVSGLSLDPDEHYRLLALTTSSHVGSYVIYVGTNVEVVTKSVDAVTDILRVGAPLLSILVALTIWLTLGRALRPVESIRSQVETISGSALDRRVPVPKATDEIGRLARTMNLMLDRLEGSSERQRRFVGDASHELKTPLASVRLQLEVALASKEAVDWGATATAVLAQNQRMERLVGDLLYLARSDEGRVQSSTGPVDIDELVLAEVARFGLNGGGPRIDVSKVAGGRVTGRAEDLRRVVQNLLDNAVRHAESLVSIELMTTGVTVKLVVGDDGPGIPPAERHRIFDRFTRLDEGRTREGGGTGLGLAIARDIIETYGGTIGVEDSAAGTRMVVRLPALSGRNQPADRPPS